MTVAEISPDGKIDVPVITYPLAYSHRFVRTGFPDRKADFYETLMIAVRTAVAPGTYVTPPNAEEEHQVYVQKSPGAKRLQDVPELKDYFGDNDDNWYALGHTLTALRFREADLLGTYNIVDKITAEVIVTEIPDDILRQIADPRFTREDFRDIIERINKPKGEVRVPYCRGQVIREMRNGIFTEVGQDTEHEAPYALHGWVRKNFDVPKDQISGYHEVAVQRGGGWLRGGGGRCLNVDAFWGRSYADSVGGVRPVGRGSLANARTEQR